MNADQHLGKALATEEPSSDGRTARRQRGRLAVCQAMIDLVFEGHTTPSAELVAERAGVSIASLFRYFDTLDDLRVEITQFYFARYEHLFDIPSIGEGTLDQRIDRFVTAREHLHRETAPMSLHARRDSFQDPTTASTVTRVRKTYADQIQHHFDQELSALTPASRETLLALIATMTSFDSWEQMVQIHDRSALQIRRSWKHGLTVLLKPHGD